MLDRLKNNAYITEFETEHLTKKFVLPKQMKSIPTHSTKHSYFTETLHDFLLNRNDMLNNTPQKQYNQLFHDKLQIHTTLDTNLQNATKKTHNTLPNTLQKFDTTLMSLDSRTNTIQTMVNNHDFQPNKHEMNITLEPHQTNSNIKFFILATTLQTGTQTNNQLTNSTPYTLPNPNNENKPFIITNTMSAPQTSLTKHT